ncbi:MAG: hypothetical protein LBR87_06740 [Synergistaceae bacterium]|jgi:hypothetical protein|nr:hypothetical protein [Synergistaceae bacterium]
MNIRTVSRAGAVQDAAHQSAYVYGIDRQFLPPKSPKRNDYIELHGPGRLDTTYQYRQIEGWLGDVPVSFTFLMAYRSYEYTKQVFSDWDRRFAVTDTSSWIV